MVDVSQPLGGASPWGAGWSLSGRRGWWSGRAGRTQRSAEFTTRQIGVLFVVLAAIASIPILLHPWPPLTDYMNHLSRMHVIATIGRDPDLARFYEINWQIVPNLMMDLVVPLIERVANVYVAGQIYTIAAFVVTMSGALALNRQLFGRWSILPLIAFPLVYNNVFLVGTMNYVFGIGLAIWSLVAWIALRERTMPLRLAVSTLCVLALFFCHLFVVGIYGIGLLAYELHRLRALAGAADVRAAGERTGWAWRAFDFVATGLPFLPVLPLMLNSPTLNLWSSYYWELEGKLDGLLYVVEMYSHFAGVLLTAIVFFAMGWATRSRVLKFHAFGWMLLLVGGAVYFAMPRVIFDTYMADQRLPISLAFMVIACAHLSLRHPLVRRGFATVLVLLLALRIFEVQTVWNAAAATTTAFRDSVQQIERGSRVLVAYADPDGSDDQKEYGLVHAACLAIIERSALVTNAFTVVGKQIMQVRAEFRDRTDAADGTPPAVAQLMEVADRTEPNTNYWANWASDYDYVYVLFTNQDFENPDPARLAAVYVGQKFALYRVVPSGVIAGDPPGTSAADTSSIDAGSQVADNAAPQTARYTPWRPVRLTR